MHVFDVGAIGVMKSICEGGDDGTKITAKLMRDPGTAPNW
jgi:hypothetical protein